MKGGSSEESVAALKGNNFLGLTIMNMNLVVKLTTQKH